MVQKSSSDKPGYRAIAADIIAAIDDGKLVQGATLESTRMLAQRLNISRDTAVRAYNFLVTHNYIESDGARGTFVKERLSTVYKRKNVSRQIELSQFGQALSTDAAFTPPQIDFSQLNFGAVPKEALPVKRWREILQEQCQSLTLRNMKYEVDVAGSLELRSALKKYLHTARGIEADPDEIIVFNISLTAVALLFKLLLEKGDTVAVEDPGYGAIKQLSKAHDLRLVAIPIDAQGIDMEILNQQNPVPRIVYVTPAHQDPTGTTMSLLRRQALLHWAQQNNSYIIEDDFDSYFSYSGAQIPTLKALDTDDRVIYVSTFWQILYPLTTASFIVAPPSLIPVLLRGKALSEGVAEAMLQTTLAEILNSGYLQTHTRKWNNTFAARRRSALFQLKKAFGAAIETQNDCGGLNMLLRLPGIAPQLVTSAAREAELPLVDIVSLFENNPAHLYLLHFASASEAQMTNKIIAFHRHLHLPLVTDR